jgi:hypothetical protein
VAYIDHEGKEHNLLAAPKVINDHSKKGHHHTKKRNYSGEDILLQTTKNIFD